MLTSINIQGFRKYHDFSIKGFGDINFILGNNNIGKTTVLESIYMFACGQNIVPCLNIPLSRGRYFKEQSPYWIMEELMSLVNDRNSLPFHLSFSGIVDGKTECFLHTIYPSELLSDYDSSYKRFQNSIVSSNSKDVIKEIPSLMQAQSSMFQISPPIVVAKWEIKHNESIITELLTAPATNVSKNRPFKLAKFIDVLSHTGVAEIVQIYSSLKREKLMDDVANEMNKVFPEIVNIDMIPYLDGSQAPISILKKDGSLLPIYTFGDGVQRWFYILGAIALYKNSIICIDEIDTGFHTEAQLEFNKHLALYAKKNNVQLFLTTHNIEYVDRFLESVNNLGADYLESTRIFSMREIDGETKVRALSAEEAIKMRRDYQMELR